MSAATMARTVHGAMAAVTSAGVSAAFLLPDQILNNGDKSKIDSFDIVIKDKNSNVLTILKGIVGKNIESNDYTKVITSTFDDLNDMYSIEYKV